jgi:hypothetical protein
MDSTASCLPDSLPAVHARRHAALLPCARKNRQSRKYMPRNGFVLFLHLLIVFDIIKMLMWQRNK